MPETLDGMIRRGEALLTDYQNAAYARRYVDPVARTCATEDQISQNKQRPLTEAVAKNLAKLMA